MIPGVPKKNDIQLSMAVTRKVIELKKFGRSGFVPYVFLHLSTKNQTDRCSHKRLIELSVTCAKIVLAQSFSKIILHNHYVVLTCFLFAVLFFVSLIHLQSIKMVSATRYFVFTAEKSLHYATHKRAKSIYRRKVF